MPAAEPGPEWVLLSTGAGARKELLRHGIHSDETGLVTEVWEPMVDHVRVHPLGGHPKERQIGGCSRSTELAIVALKRSWRQIFRWKTGRRAENGKWPGVEVITVAPDSRAVGTAQHRRHRTIDPQCLRKSPLRRGAIFALTENVASPVHAGQDRVVPRSLSREGPASGLS